MSRQIWLLSMIPLLLGVLSLSVRGSYYTGDMIRDYLIYYAEEELNRQSRQVESFINESISDLQALASQKPLKEGNIPEIMAYLKSQHSFFAHKFRSFYWDEMNGDVTGMEGVKFSVRDRYFFKDFTSGKTVISKLIKDKASGLDIMLILVPVFNNGQQVGGLGATVSVESLLRNALSRPLKYQGVPVLIDIDGNMIKQPTKWEEHIRMESMKEEDATPFGLDPKVFKESNRHDVRLGVKVYNPEGDAFRIFYRQLSPTDWTLAAVFPKAALMQPVQEMRESAFVLLVSVLLIALVFFTQLVHFMLKPVERLKIAYQRVADGNLAVEVPVSANDEIGALTASFNNMVGSLREETRVHGKNREELLRATVEAKRASDAKSRFIANMSHELRTPLQGIGGAAEIIEGSCNDPEVHRYTKIIERSVKELGRLSNDILELLELGHEKINQREFDPRSLIEGIVDLMELKAEEKNLQIRLHDTDVSKRYRGDETKIRQILINLVANAIKYTREGEIAIHVSGDNFRDGKQDVRFEVADTGIGISDESKERLFEQFFQVQKNETSSGGVGLAIANHLVKLLGGRLHVKSQIGKGSVFWFVVPLEVVES